MGFLLQKFAFERTTFRKSEAQSADSVAEHIDAVKRGIELDKTAKNVVGALASSMGVFTKDADGNFVLTKVSEVFLKLYSANKADAWRWLVARSLWRFVVPNGTASKVNAPADAEKPAFAFFHSIVQLLTHLSAETGSKRFLFFEELCKLLNEDSNWTKSGAELFSLVSAARSKPESGFGSSRAFLEDLEVSYQIPRDNFNGLFSKAFAQTGFFEPLVKSGKVVAIALNPDLDAVLQRRLRFILDHPPKWSGADWPTYMDMQPEDLPQEVTEKEIESPLIPATDPVEMKELISAAKQSLNTANILVTTELLLRFVASLQAKRFLILTGLAGSGKTKLAQAFARWLSPTHTVADPFAPGAKLLSARKEYTISNSDSLGVEVINEEGTKVLLPREIISQWANYVEANNVPETIPAQELRHLIKTAGGEYSDYFQNLETHYKPAAFALIKARATQVAIKCYEVVPVGADWTGSENIVGYPDGLNSGSYITKPALELIRSAIKQSSIPHFLILDEMNLSHVERYFADLLSAIESSERIPLYEGDLRKSNNQEIPRKLALPDNLFVIGTVNVDETTYLFSPKVLDRANVIEFRMEPSELTAFLAAPSKPKLELLDGAGIAYGKHFIDAVKDSVALPPAVKVAYEAEMLVLFNLLRAHNAEFGYRTAHEAARFVHFYQQLGGHTADNIDWFNGAMDCVIVQKVLPKLHGSRSKLEGLLWALAWVCGMERGDNFAAQLREASLAEDESKFSPEIIWSSLKAKNATEPSKAARYPFSFDKVMRMWRKLVRDQFVNSSEA